MRPASLRRDRQKQYNYMSQGEYEQELKMQVEEKKRLQIQEKVQDQQEILNHYKNYALGADHGSGENAHYMQDLDQLVRNREQEIQRLGGAAFAGGIRNEGFQGDMNALQKQPPQQMGFQPQQQINDKKNFDLFSNNFVQSYQQQQPKTNENLNIINSIFGNANPNPASQGASSAAESERERRLKLRELERMKRQEGFQGGDYGQVSGQPISQKQDQAIPSTQMTIFGGGDSKPQSQQASKREEVWQQKLQQRMNTQEGVRQPNHQPSSFQPSVQQMLPIFQNQGMAPVQQQQYDGGMPDYNDVRSSRIIANLNDARKLDQSINLEKQEKPPVSGGYLKLGGDDELIKQRRDNEKKIKQQEYQQFLAKQNQQSKSSQNVTQIQPANNIISQNTPITAPSSSQSNQRPSYRSGSDHSPNQVLQMGAMQQLGMHQQKQQDDKLRMQREYKQMLDMQNQQKQQHNQNYNISADRKKELSDQVFAEMFGASPQFQPQQIQPMENNIPQQPPIMARNQSAIGQSRPEHQDQGIVSRMGGPGNDDEKKKAEFEKKRLYALELQQQMQLKQQQLGSQDKKRRGTSQQVHQQPQISQDNVFQQQQQYQPQKQVFEYQQPPMVNHMPIQNQFQPLQADVYFQQQQQQYAPSFPDYAQNMPPQHHFQAPQLHNVQADFPPQQQLQQQQFFNHQGAPDAKEQQRLKQDEYRRELEMQIRLKEEQKKMQNADQQLYEMKQDRDFQQIGAAQQNPRSQIQPPQMNEMPQYSQQPPTSAQSNFVRQRTDLSRKIDPQEDQEKALKQLQYQQELQIQMEEKKRKKEEEKRKKLQDDEEHERKLQLELDQLNHKDHQELVKEGRRDPNAPYQAPKPKVIRRDQFEPSQEMKAQISIPAVQDNWQKPVEYKKESLFGNDNPQPSKAFAGFGNQGPSFELPINNKREDMFGGAQKMTSGGDLPIYSQDSSAFNHPQAFRNDQPMYQQQQPQPNFNQYAQPDQNQQKMMEEQQKMIQMYQQALEQILQFRNQYFEQGMQMRENIIKEREQLLEYEKMKQQQTQEIDQLKAVYNQLGSILTTTNQRPISATSQQQMQGSYVTPLLNPQVQSNLNNLIINQKEQIVRMSQGEGFNFKDKMQSLYPNQQQQQYQMREEHPNILEQSLSSDTKFVNVPLNKLTQLAQSSGGQLFQTWKQDQLQSPNNQLHIGQQNLPSAQMQQTMNQSLAGNSQFQQFNHTPQKLINTGSKPSFMSGLHHGASRPQTSNPPETIPELPKEEDEQVNQSRSTMNAKQAQQLNQDEELDFNQRDDSPSQSRQEQQMPQMSKQSSQGDRTMQGNMITNTNPLGNTSTIKENIMQIEQMLAQSRAPVQLQPNAVPVGMQQPIISPANKTQEKFQNASGSSFYNQTMQNQKQQEQTQMEELQKQLMRIFGNTQNSEGQQPISIIQQMQQKPATPLQNQRQQQQQQQQQQFISPLQRASYNERMSTVNDEEQDILAQSNINIAESVGGTQTMNEAIYQAKQKFSSNGFYAQQQPYDNNIVDESRPVYQQLTDQAEEVSMNDKPKIYESTNQRQYQFQESQDVWNDPDLIPPPVVMMNNEDEDYYFEPQINQSQMNPYGTSELNDGTLKGLEMFSPPSDEQNYNLGNYESQQMESQDEEYGTMLTQNHLVEERKYEMLSNPSATRKERDLKDMMEVNKLIQKATDTANNLFENSENFKFRMKKEQVGENIQTPTSNQNRQQPSFQTQGSRKNIKTVDPFKKAELKPQNSGINLAMIEKPEKDDDILSNLDRMISNLQEQQNQNPSNSNIMKEDEYRERPVSGIPRPGSNMERSKSNKKNRPISAIDNQQQKIGKYAQMAVQQNQDQQSNYQRSQKSLGRFAQMALNGVDNQDIVQEVANKYADLDRDKLGQDQYLQLQQLYQQQSILRPVSGKSNSNRYQPKPQSQQSQRNRSNPRQQEAFYDEETDDFQQQQQQQQQNSNRTPFGRQPEVGDDQEMSTSGFNIGCE